jgi:hypothetical protein
LSWDLDLRPVTGAGGKDLNLSPGVFSLDLTGHDGVGKFYPFDRENQKLAQIPEAIAIPNPATNKSLQGGKP